MLAILISNWLPHFEDDPSHGDRMSALQYDMAEPLNVLAWPFLTFTAVLMITFIIQSVQYEKPGRTMARIAGTVLVVAYVGLLGSFTIQMRWIPGSSEGFLALAYLVATAKGATRGRTRWVASPVATSSGPRSAPTRRSRGRGRTRVRGGRGADCRDDRPLRCSMFPRSSGRSLSSSGWWWARSPSSAT